MPYHIRSLRDYLAELTRLGEVQPIDEEVDWDLEIGAITRRAYELPAAAPLFNKVKDSEPGFRVLGAPVGLSAHRERPLTRIALSLGLPIDSSGAEIVADWSRLPDVTPIPPRRVSDAPCQQHTVMGEGIDLRRLPVPFLHVGDGGRYLNTYGVFVVAAPDGSWVNWSIARAMLHDARSMIAAAIGGQHLSALLDRWRQHGRDMPFALAIGVDPGIAMVAGYPLPEQVSEREAIGGWFGEPLDVVRCLTNDLEVPATSELVLEGTVALDEDAPEGPMGEYTGYTATGRTTAKPVYHVEALTHRDDPILPVVVSGLPPEENHTNWGIAVAAALQHDLREQGLPVRRCFIPFAAAGHWAVVTVDTTRPPADGFTWAGLARRIGEAAFATRAGYYLPKMIVVDDEIDPADLHQVVWALATRNHPDGVIHLADQPTLPLVAYLTTQEKTAGRTIKAVYNCLPSDDWPADWRPRTASFADYPNELQAHVLARWHDLGYSTCQPRGAVTLNP